MTLKATNITYKILVVDDEPDLLEMLADEMRDAGHDVLTASSGNQAMARVAETKIDVIISDVRMPDGNGLDLLKMVRKHATVRPAFVFITGYSDLRVDELYEKGAEAVFTKPLNLQALRRTVAEFAAARTSQQSSRVNQRVEGDFAGRFWSSQLKDREAFLSNLSLSGAFFAVGDASFLPEVGVEVEFFVSSSFSRKLSVKGKGTVRWRRVAAAGDLPIGFGLEFKDLAPEARQALAILVNDAKTQPLILGRTS